MMIELPTVFVRAGRGRIRILRLASDARHIYPARYTVRPGGAWCRLCGCTDAFGCIGGCGWVNARKTCCTRCYERMLT